MEYKDYSYRSVLAPHICSLLEEKRSLGFAYNVMAYQLFRFDQYWMDHGFCDVRMSPERLNDWVKALPGESKSSQNGRIGAARILGYYLAARNLNTYVPMIGAGTDHIVIHIFSKEEIHQLFAEIDNYIPISNNPADFRMANEYPVIFRLYYCCGMRNNEACALKVSDLDLTLGVITVRNAKNKKDRLVYLPKDLTLLAKQYLQWLTNTLGYEPVWLFPGRDPNRHMLKTSIDRIFRIFWNRTAASKTCEKIPTPHCLRHTFVVDRINSWILNGEDINVMSSYLSKYLGHKSWDESFYYYHLVDDAFRIVKSRDTFSEDVIPEVRRR